MRLEEILTEARRNVEELKAAIENNEKPVIEAATYSAYGWAWGDLEKLGWAKRHRRVISARQALVEEWWEYTGPNSIMAKFYLGAKPVEMTSGDTTPETEVDYS